jgi:tetrahydromethanopterin S-methyltransferase subunit E
MRLLSQVAGTGWVVGFMVSVVSKLSPIIDDSISIIAGLVGIVAGLIWVGILLNKSKESKVSLDNARLDNKIKNQQLIKLQNESKNNALKNE